MGRVAELRGELRWQLLFNGAKDGKPQSLQFSKSRRKFWINEQYSKSNAKRSLNISPYRNQANCTITQIIIVWANQCCRTDCDFDPQFVKECK